MTFESEIATIMRDLSSKDWNIRFRSLQKLQVIVAEHGDDNSAWTRDILVALHKPLMAQLKDLRSSIVREVCEYNHKSPLKIVLMIITSADDDSSLFISSTGQ